ncbi:hypothetical protein FEM48_ZijujUnG0043600 [Ziziphus jujuba var. spinosa]|uniref:Uncharacterized protein n=1 Tax=Ziziphus jujuba var. spinosa TaxID=714518 RepID=A0A978U999_ZIZJJ|nr:hypothetical protein FEM48_ZijujUnG0043600 [Ziziphus jujuba var. spinosa]
MVRTHRILPSRLNPRPATRFVNEFDLPPTAGLFTKVSSKPTNHSKFTGKCCKARCNGCHMHPACKAKDKTKGTQKLRSCDVVSNHRLVTWRVVEGRQGLNFSGYSASAQTIFKLSKHNMKREGRQHGMVRTYRILPSPLNPRPGTRFVNQLDTPPTAGLFTKVSSKPTNHSKFTGKCGKAHCTGCHMHSACKAKDKTKGTQKIRSCDVISNHRLVTWRGRQGLNFSGYSASGLLDQLSTQIMINNGDDENGNRGGADAISYCNVGFVMDPAEVDEDWCLVGEM